MHIVHGMDIIDLVSVKNRQYSRYLRTNNHIIRHLQTCNNILMKIYKNNK